MQAAEDSFISSTFWTERVGYIAKYNIRSYEKIKTLGKFD